MEIIKELEDGTEVYISSMEIDSEHPDEEYEVWLGLPNGDVATEGFYTDYDEALDIALAMTMNTRTLLTKGAEDA